MLRRVMMAGPGSAPPVGNFAEVVLSANPAIYWRMQSASGNEPDLSGNGKAGVVMPGVIRSQPSIVEPGGDSSMRFGASGSYLTTQTREPCPQGNLSYAVVFKADVGAGYGPLVAPKDISDPSSPGGASDKLLYMDTSGRLFVAVWVGSQNFARTEESYNDGLPHIVHVVFGGTAAEGYAIYVDGVKKAETLNAISVASDARYYYTGQGAIGAWPGGGTSECFTGIIDEFAVFYSKLTAAQILAQAVAAGRA